MSKTLSEGYLDKLRNIGIIAHIDAGKTTLTERILFYTHKIHRMGEVHEGTATMDFMPEEQERGITITAACTTCTWGKHTINIIDTPGHVDFTIEVERALRVLDGAVGVFCAVGGVEPQSETVWRQSEKFQVPKLAFVNKMDRPGADFQAVIQAMRDKLRARPLAVLLPVGSEQDFKGLIDLVSMERLLFNVESQGEELERRPLDEEELEYATPWREKLLETLAEEDDSLLERYLGGEEIPVPEIKAAIRKATLGLKLVPVYAGSALKNTGVQPLLDGVVDYLPGPRETVEAQGRDLATLEKVSIAATPNAPLAGLVFKVSTETGRRLVWCRLYSGKISPNDLVFNSTQQVEERAARIFRLHAGQKEKLDQALAGHIVAIAGMKYARTGDTLCEKAHPYQLESIASYKPVISLALEPRNSEEGARLNAARDRFLVEDPTLFVEKDKDTEQLVLSGMGELHLEIILDRLRREYHLEPRSGNPQVVYQETITRPATGRGLFERELGEVMHHGDVTLEMEPLPRDSGRQIEFAVDREKFPPALVDAVAQGVSDSMESGVLKGYPVQDIRVRITGMQRKEGVSSPAGFHMAAVAAVKQALAEAGGALLEPIMWVEISVPDDFVGEAIGLLGSRGSKVENMFDRAGQKVVQALTPMRQLFGFSTALRSATQGRAGFMLKFHRFDMLQ